MVLLGSPDNLSNCFISFCAIIEILNTQKRNKTLINICLHKYLNFYFYI